MVLTLFKLRMKQFLVGLVTNKRSENMGKGGKVAFGALFVFLILCFAGVMAGLSFALSTAFGETEYAWLYFAFNGVLAFALCFVGSVFAAMNYLYKAKDNELLLSMPVKPGQILLSRMLVLLVENYIFGFIVLIPAGIVWAIMQSFTFVGAIFYIIGMLAIPVLSLTVSCIVGWILMTVSSKFKNKKIITVVIFAALFGAYMLFASKWGEYLEQLMLNGSAVAAAFESYVLPFYHFGKAVLEGNIVSFLILVLCVAVPFGITYFVLEKNYVRIMTTNKGEKRRRYKEGKMKSAGIKTALVKKEISRFTSSAMYIMNASMGAMMMVVLAVALLIKKDEVLSVVEVLPIAGDFAPAAVSVILCLCASMVTIAAPSVSVEGKHLWLAKSLPVSGFDVLDAKALCHIVVTLPFAVVAGIISAIALKSNAWQSIQLITLPVAMSVFCAYFGVTVNLKFPKFDWISEIHCIKQSGSVAISMFGMMGVVAVMAIAYIAALRHFMAADACVLLYTIILALLGILLRRGLKNKGNYAFEKLQG